MLLSRDPAKRNEAFDTFGLPFIATRDPQDIRLFAVNMDSHPDLERVVIATSDLDVEAAVLRRDNDVWWELGHFVCCGPGARSSLPFLELRQTVSYGTNDIIVHAGGSQGSGVGELRLMIFRVWNSKLYKVLDIVESAYNFSQSEETRISYPDTGDSGEPRILTVHRTKEIRGRRTSLCELYRWDAGKFTFLRTAPDRKRCSSR